MELEVMLSNNCKLEIESLSSATSGMGRLMLNTLSSVYIPDKLQAAAQRAALKNFMD